MSEKSIKRGESGWIAEEIFSDQDLDLYSKCVSVDDQVARGVLDLDKALEIYQVPIQAYLDFYVERQDEEIKARIHSNSGRLTTLYKIKLIKSLTEQLLATMSNYKRATAFRNIVDDMEDGVWTERIKVTKE